jgi:hypothetical protein
MKNPPQFNWDDGGERGGVTLPASTPFDISSRIIYPAQELKPALKWG